MCVFKYQYDLYILGQRRKSLSGAATYNYFMKPTPSGFVFTEATVQEIHQLRDWWCYPDGNQARYLFMHSRSVLIMFV